MNGRIALWAIMFVLVFIGVWAFSNGFRLDRFWTLLAGMITAWIIAPVFNDILYGREND